MGGVFFSSFVFSQQPDENECILICIDSINVFTRPDSNALFMSRLAPRNQVTISGKTIDGWLGFDPGVAQAANLGSFRLRWIADDEKYVIDGELSDVPVVWGPQAGITYAMIYRTSPLYSEPDRFSSVVDSIPSSSAAGIVSRTEEWYLLDLNIGPLGQDIEGWIEATDISVSGNLDTIPIIE
jgi:hypothetical protein